jgi:hypothetical protein
VRYCLWGTNWVLKYYLEEQFILVASFVLPQKFSLYHYYSSWISLLKSSSWWKRLRNRTRRHSIITRDDNLRHDIRGTSVERAEDYIHAGNRFLLSTFFNDASGIRVCDSPRGEVYTRLAGDYPCKDAHAVTATRRYAVMSSCKLSVPVLICTQNMKVFTNLRSTVLC